MQQYPPQQQKFYADGSPYAGNAYNNGYPPPQQAPGYYNQQQQAPGYYNQQPAPGYYNQQRGQNTAREEELCCCLGLLALCCCFF